VLVAVVIGVAAGAAAYMWYRPTPDCRTAAAAISFVAEQRDLLDPKLITADGPDLSKYQDWSDQLEGYANRVSAPDVTPHLRRIAELSGQAVAIVREVRNAPPDRSAPGQIERREWAYHDATAAIVDEENALNSGCRR
jgi:hypothetical protein